MSIRISARGLLLLPVLLAAIALPVSPALAGEEEDGEEETGSATLDVAQGCVSRDRARVVVTGENIDSVAFFVDGDRVRTVSRPGAGGRFSLSMSCSRLSVGAHRARAVVTFEQGTTPARRTLRFQITRSRQQVSPRQTG
jgi:hypothetical protein